MRIPGWCEKCRKVKTVRVTHPRPGNNVQVGMCDACREKEQKR